MTPLDAINQHRYTYFGFKDVSTADHPYQYLPALCYSDNLTNWDVVQYYPELGNCGAQSVAKIGDWYYVVATGYLMRTKNLSSLINLIIRWTNRASSNTCGRQKFLPMLTATITLHTVQLKTTLR